MPPKRATYFSYGEDESCTQTRKFIEDSGVLLTFRDLEKRPFSEREVANLVGHLDIRHFLNKASDSYVGKGLDKGLPDRQELIKMMAVDYTLLRKPIIKASRLITIGCDQKRISELLQLVGNGGQEIDDRVGNTSPRKKNGRRSGPGNGKK